jgi:hypothetical protein
LPNEKLTADYTGRFAPVLVDTVTTICSVAVLNAAEQVARPVIGVHEQVVVDEKTY